MRIALVLRGYHYLYIPQRIYSDFEESIQNFEETIFKPLSEAGHEIDVFCLTYNSEKLNRMLELFKPVRTLVLDPSEIAVNSGYILKYWQLISDEEIIKHESKIDKKYDVIINTRFDISFHCKITEMNIDYSKYNIAFKHSSGNCDDNLWIYPRSMIEKRKTIFLDMLKNNKIMHTLNSYLTEDEIHYMYEVSEEDWKNGEEYKLFHYTRWKQEDERSYKYRIKD